MLDVAAPGGGLAAAAMHYPLRHSCIAVWGCSPPAAHYTMAAATAHDKKKYARAFRVPDCSAMFKTHDGISRASV